MEKRVELEAEGNMSQVQLLAYNGDVERLTSLLLFQGKPDYNNSNCYTTGLTALMLATDKSHKECMKVLIANGASVDAKITAVHLHCIHVLQPSRLLWTPLHFAAFNADYEAIKILLDAGSDPNKAAPILPLHCLVMSSAAERKVLKCLELLMEKGADVNQCGSGNSRMTALKAACTLHPRASVIRVLHRCGAVEEEYKFEANFWIHEEESPCFNTAPQLLIRGIQKRDCMQKRAAFETYLELYGANHQCWNCFKVRTSGLHEDYIIFKTDLVHLAVYSKMAHLVKVLLKKGATVRTPSMIIKSSNGRFTAADLHLFSSVVDGESLPCNATSQELYPTLFMLFRHGHNPDQIYYAQNSDHKTRPLGEYFIFIRPFQCRILQELLKYKCYPLHDNASICHFFKTAMTHDVTSAENTAVRCLDSFLSSGLDPNVEPIQGETALVMAILNGESKDSILECRDHVTVIHTIKISSPYRLDQGCQRDRIMKLLLLHGASQAREEIETAFDLLLAAFNKLMRSLHQRGVFQRDIEAEIEQFAAETISKANILRTTGLLSQQFHQKVITFCLCEYLSSKQNYQNHADFVADYGVETLSNLSRMVIFGSMKKRDVAAAGKLGLPNSLAEKFCFRSKALKGEKGKMLTMKQYWEESAWKKS